MAIISISITHTGAVPFNNENFRIVEQANVEVFENGNYLGIAGYNEIAKRYILDYYPSPGKAFTKSPKSSTEYLKDLSDRLRVKKA